MTGKTKIPEAIAHLDFDPDVAGTPDEAPADDELHECDIKECTRVADWVGRMGCCKFDFYACNKCQTAVLRLGVTCRADRCGKTRESRWITGWRRL